MHRPETHWVLLTLGMMILTIIWGTVDTNPPRQTVFLVDQSQELYTFGIFAIVVVLAWLALVSNFLIMRKYGWLIGVKVFRKETPFSAFSVSSRPVRFFGGVCGIVASPFPFAILLLGLNPPPLVPVS